MPPWMSGGVSGDSLRQLRALDLALESARLVCPRRWQSRHVARAPVRAMTHAVMSRHSVRVAIQLELGWRWRRVSGSRVAHLVPPHPGHHSRTACNRLPVTEATLETPAGLLTEVELCSVCTKADR
jgi:hypothetical protein